MDDRRRPTAVRRECALFEQQAGHLLHEQRVALRLVIHDCCQLLIGGEPGGDPDEIRNLRWSESPERDEPRAPAADELCQGGRQRVIHGALVVPIRAHQENAVITKCSRDEAQQQQRWCVGDLQVVEHEHHGPRRCQVLERSRHCVEETEASSVWVASARLAFVEDDATHIRDELRDLSCSVAQRRPQRGPVQVTEE